LTCPAISDTKCTMTKGIGAAKFRGPLTDLDNEVMRAVWDLGPCSVEAVHQAISPNRDLKEGTTRTLLRRLEQKGYLKHVEKDRAYIYSAVEPARSLAARAVRQIIDRLCQGSVEELVSGLVESKVMSKDELDRLEKYVRSRREKGK
jgi:BlaI family penicillinase repressor